MNQYASRTMFLAIILCFITGMTVVHGQGAVASAAQVKSRHDMSHPVLMSGSFGSSGQAGTFKHFSPQDNLPSNCYNHVGYPQTEKDGHNTWTVSKGDLMGWVQYWWCPTYQGDPNGLNFTYGRTYVTSGCEFVEVGEGTLAAGAYMQKLNGPGYYDQEPLHGWTTCASSAPNNYIWDYSQPASGAPGNAYQATMISVAPNESLSFYTNSYDFQ